MARKRCFIYVYCTEEEKRRIKAMAKARRQKVSAYAIEHIMRQVVLDERSLSIAKHRINP